MIVGNDEKLTFDENNKGIPQPPGKDSVSIIDISNAAAPKIVATLPLANSIVGPPVNLAIHPSARDRTGCQFGECRAGQQPAEESCRTTDLT